QHLERLRFTIFPEQVRVQLAKTRSRPLLVAAECQHACGGDASLDVGRIDSAEADRDLVGTFSIAARAPPRSDGVEVRLRVDEETLFDRDLRQKQVGLLVAGNNLEDL